MSSVSRIAKTAITIPSGVKVSTDGKTVTVQGPKVTVTKEILRDGIELAVQNNEVQVIVTRNDLKALSGTVAALVKKLITGVTTEFERRLQLVGVGYRAQMQGNVLDLTLGFSHPVNFTPPPGVTIETPSQTEIVLKGPDDEVVCRVASEIRAYRPPEPYKGKGIRYADEKIKVKETKKK